MSESLVEVRLEIQTKPRKNQELLKTFDELHRIIGKQTGCHKIIVSQPKSEKNRVIINEKWATNKDALHHFNSESFFVISGATKVLAQSLKMTIKNKLQTSSIDLKHPISQKEIYSWAEKVLSETQI